MPIRVSLFVNSLAEHITNCQAVENSRYSRLGPISAYFYNLIMAVLARGIGDSLSRFIALVLLDGELREPKKLSSRGVPVSGLFELLS